MNALLFLKRIPSIAYAIVGVIVLSVLLGVWHNHAQHSFSVASSQATRDSITKETTVIVARTDTVIIERASQYATQKARVDSLAMAHQLHVELSRKATEALEARIRAESAEAQRDSTVQAVNAAARTAIAENDSLIQSANLFAHEKQVERDRADSVIAVLQSERSDNARLRVIANDALRAEVAKGHCGKLCTVKHVVVGGLLTGGVVALKQVVRK